MAYLKVVVPGSVSIARLSAWSTGLWQWVIKSRSERVIRLQSHRCQRPPGAARLALPPAFVPVALLPPGASGIHGSIEYLFQKPAGILRGSDRLFPCD